MVVVSNGVGEIAVSRCATVGLRFPKVHLVPATKVYSAT